MHRNLNIWNKCLLGCAVVVAATAASGFAHAKSPGVLHTFVGGSDGAGPSGGGLLLDSAGNLYGTTAEGGVHGYGVVYKMAPDGTETVLYSFGGLPDGGVPYYNWLVADNKGNLYGETTFGGTNNAGTVFKVTPDGKEKVLYAFKADASDGGFPVSGLVRDSAGNLYGTAEYSGKYRSGAVFKLTPDGTETVLHFFQGAPDGGVPKGTLVMDKAGNLYGTTQLGGTATACGSYGCGTVFKVMPDGTESVLYSFQGGADGGGPESGLIADANGNLYGTTSYGGTGNACGGGCGTIFRIAPDGTETVLYSFMGTSGNPPTPGGVIQDRSGNIFGTTEYGGTHDKGTVFELTLDGTETALASFACSRDGCDPSGGLTADRAGNLYGTTGKGGPLHCGERNRGGCGTVFKIRK